MTTARHIVTLLKSHIAGDEDRFLATAMQLAAHEARQGHSKLAQELKELVDGAKDREPTMRREARPVPLVQPKGELAGLLDARYPDLRLADMILAGRITRPSGARARRATPATEPCANTGSIRVASCSWSVRPARAKR